MQMGNYFLVVIDEDDQVVDKIPADHKTEKQLLASIKQQYQGKNYKFKFGNMVRWPRFFT